MASTPDALVKKLQSLAALAVSSNEHEARTAAMTACKIIREHGDRLLVRANAPATRVAPTKPSTPSVVHPTAAAFNEWRAFMRQHAVQEVQAKERGFCLSCGEEFRQAERVVQVLGVGTTHDRCSGWWWKYPFPPPDDDDIPF